MSAPAARSDRAVLRTSTLDLRFVGAGRWITEHAQKEPQRTSSPPSAAAPSLEQVLGRLSHASTRLPLPPSALSWDLGLGGVSGGTDRVRCVQSWGWAPIL